MSKFITSLIHLPRIFIAARVRGKSLNLHGEWLNIVVDWLMVDWFYVCYILDNVYVLGALLLTALTFQSTLFFRTIYSTIGDFKISTSLISNRYQHCAITSMMTKVDAQHQQRSNHFMWDWYKKTVGEERQRHLNDASVNASIRLYLRVMIIMRQERHNKAAE